MAEYIEREAAYTLSKRICDAIRNREYHPATFGHLILDWIDDLPAADVQPVRHGRFEVRETIDKRYTVCSVCKRILTKNTGRYRVKYCPNCGAKMDKEGEG